MKRLNLRFQKFIYWFECAIGPYLTNERKYDRLINSIKIRAYLIKQLENEILRDDINL